MLTRHYHHAHHSEIYEQFNENYHDYGNVINLHHHCLMNAIISACVHVFYQLIVLHQYLDHYDLIILSRCENDSF